MKSGFITLLRATIMLAVLVGLPALAMHGTDRSLSEVVAPIWKQVQERIAEFRDPDASGDGEEESLLASNLTGTELPNISGPNPSASISAVRVPGSTGPEVATTISPNRSVGPSPAPDPVGHFPAPSPLAAGHPAGTDDPMMKIESQLRELGASHYLLERWGGDSELFRFRCEMSLAGHSDLNRYFEATDANPVVAMSRVLHEIGTWKTATARRIAPAGGTVRR